MGNHTAAVRPTVLIRADNDDLCSTGIQPTSSWKFKKFSYTHRRVVWLVVGSCECGCVRERRVEFVRGQR